MANQSKPHSKTLGNTDARWVIEKDIPIPNRVTGKGASKYGFRDMEVGDSILFPDEPLGMKSRPSESARKTQNRSEGKKEYTVRKEGSGVRVWRIK